MEEELMLALYITPKNEIERVKITYEDLEDYEGYAPIYKKYNLSIFVLNRDNATYKDDMRPNKIASKIYDAKIYGSCYFLLDIINTNDDEYEEKNKNILKNKEQYENLMTQELEKLYIDLNDLKGKL